METDQVPSLKPLGRYYTYAQFEQHFMNVIEALPPNQYAFSFLGSSVQDRSIYGLKIGSGTTKILAWSQMHGNESTTTRAIIDLLKSPDLFQLLKNITLYIIPVLNPDGTQDWTRVNANQVDLNRDAIDLSQPESLILKEAIDFFEPHVALNLHGQRSIYGVADSVLPCQLSFLTPSGDVDKTISESRIKSMNLINAIVQEIATKSKAAIGRYDDAFNINCWGDYCQSIGIPTILFEAGHAGNDYSRDQVKDLILLSLKTVLKTAGQKQALNEDKISSAYFDIPEVRKNYVDILLRNVPSISGPSTIAVMYYEQVIEGQLEFVPMVYAINEDSITYGHKVIDLNDNSDYKNDLEISGDMSIVSKSLNISSFIK